jgi:hypothetical protein
MSTENQTNTPGALAGATPIPTPLNVTALAKRFGVARTTIRRRLKKGRQPPATVPRRARKAAADAAPAAPPCAPHAVAPDAPSARAVAAATLCAALALATCSATFSISGLTAIFAGAFWPVIGLGVAFEVGKLSAVAWLGRGRGAAPLRAALVALVGVLMVLQLHRRLRLPEPRPYRACPRRQPDGGRPRRRDRCQDHGASRDRGRR